MTWPIAGLAVVAFLVGGTSPATLVARALGADLSRSGSGNPGATNAGRVLGRRWGVLVGVADVLKGLAPPVTAHLLGWPVWAAYLLGGAAVLGHVFSPFLRGRGGKGVATGLGALLGVHPWYAASVLAVFALVLAVRRWVALASMVSAALLVVGGALAAVGRLPGGHGWPTAVFLTGLGLLILARHGANLRRWWQARRAGGRGPA